MPIGPLVPTDFDVTIGEVEEAPPVRPDTRAWAAALDRLNYYELLRLPMPNQGHSAVGEVRRAFHDFALAFHPDAHRDAPPEDQAAAQQVFVRGVEAYRILREPRLEASYLEHLRGGVLRMSAEQVTDATRPQRERIRLADIVRTPTARPFAQRAEELLTAGDLRQARLQLQLALIREPDNAKLRSTLTEIDSALSNNPPRS